MAIKHRIRTENDKTKVVKLTARMAVREFCKECMGFNAAEVKRCTDKLCPLYPFRSYDTPKDTA